jgi:hypothetical protein
MQLSLTPVTVLFTLTLLSSSSALLHPRQATLNLPNSLCAFNLDSTNDHTIDAQCDIGPAIVSSKVALEKCITNSLGQLQVSSLTPWHNLLDKMKMLILSSS